MKLPQKFFLETKYVFFSTLAIIVIVIFSVWLSGEASHRSLFQNSMLSTSVLAGAFFLFITLGLYFGLKLKDNIGNILSKERIQRYADKTPKFDGFDFDPPAVGDGIGGVIFSILLWIIISILLIFVSYFFGLFFWSAVLLLGAILYWIFFRALRLVFKNSGKCKGNLLKSLGFGIFYSFLYISWMYGIIFLIRYLH
jgi:small-conductance mechanosensitive channel